MDILNLENLTAKENQIFSIGINTKGLLRGAILMDTDSLNGAMEIVIKAAMRKAKRMGMEF